MDDLEGLRIDFKEEAKQEPEEWITTPSSWQQTSAPTSISSSQYEQTDILASLFATARNPVACMFHVLFKGAAIVSFLFLNAFLDQEIISFVVIVMFAAIDFWTV